MKKDEEDFDREWSKIKADELILVGSPLDMDWGEDDEHAIDMDKSIASEANRGCLEKKKKFLITFLTRKLVELGNRKTTARTLGRDRPLKSLVQLKKGEKIFRVTMEGSDLDETEETAHQQWHSDLERALSAAVGNPPRPKYKKGPCPLRCEFFHPNRSV